MQKMISYFLLGLGGILSSVLIIVVADMFAEPSTFDHSYWLLGFGDCLSDWQFRSMLIVVGTVGILAVIGGVALLARSRRAKNIA
jgi:hypothetical protein